MSSSEPAHSIQDGFAVAPEAGFFCWDMRSNITYADAAVARLYGLDPDKTSKGLPIEDYVARIYEPDRPRITEAITNCIKGNYPQQEIYRVVNGCGRLASVLGYGRVFMNANGEPTQYVGLIVPTDEAVSDNDNEV